MLLLSEDQEQKRGDDQIRLCDTAPVLTITHYKITHYTHYCHYSNVLQSNVTSHFYSYYSNFCRYLCYKGPSVLCTLD